MTNYDDDFDNFDTEGVADDGGGFEPLKAGDYDALRVIAFQRTTSKTGKPQIALRVKALKGPSSGTTNGYITLTSAAKRFVKRWVLAASGGQRWVGSLRQDEDAKRLFLGKVISGKITNTTKNGKTSDWLDSVWAAPEHVVMDHPHEDPDKYWSAEVFASRSAVGNSSRQSAPGSSDAPPQSSFDDDDIPF